MAQASDITLGEVGHRDAGTMRTTLKHIAVKVAGWAFILLGIAGLFLPILQGILFLLIGLTLLSAEYVWAHRLLAHLHMRFPSLHLQIKKATDWAGGWRQRPKARGQEKKGELNSPGHVRDASRAEGRDK